MKTHTYFQKLLAVYRELDPETRREIEAHLQTCATCAAQAQSNRQMDRLLADLPDPRPDSGLRSSFYTALEKQSQSKWRSWQPMRTFPKLALQLALVAVILVLGWATWSGLQQRQTAVSATPTAATQEATAESRLQLTGYQVQQSDQSTLLVTLEWTAPAPQEVAYTLFMHLLDQEGVLHYQLDETLNVNTWPAGTPVTTTHRLLLPAGLEGGPYSLQAGIYNAATGQRLPFLYKDALMADGALTLVDDLQIGPVDTGAESHFTPIAETGGNIRLVSWSPDGTILAFSAETADPTTPQPAEGALRLYDTANRRFCPLPIVEPPQHGRYQWHVWLPDNTFFYLSTDGSPVFHTPCGQETTPLPKPARAIAAQSEDRQLLLLKTDASHRLYRVTDALSLVAEFTVEIDPAAYSFSPDGTLLAISGVAGETHIVEVENGRPIQVIPWGAQLWLSSILPDPLWLNNETLLILRTEEGPLLVPVGQEPQPVGPALFGSEIDPQQTHAEGVAHREAGTYTIALYEVGATDARAPVRLYHSATGEVETLPFTQLWGQGFTPGGQWLLLNNPVDENGTESYELWVRETAAAGQEPTRFFHTAQFPYPAWSPDGRKVAFQPTPSTLEVRSFPTAEVLQQWNVFDDLNYATFGVLQWSPDGRQLAVVAGMSGVARSGLFILP